MNLLGDGAKPWKTVLSSDGLSDAGTERERTEEQ